MSIFSIFTNSKNSKHSYNNNNYNTPEKYRSGYSFNPYEDDTLNKIKGYLVPTKESDDLDENQVVLIGIFF